jgi:hypothetical protein
MRISLTDEGRKLTFEEFAMMFGEHFKSYIDPVLPLMQWYKKLTGNDPYPIRTKPVKAKHRKNNS